MTIGPTSSQGAQQPIKARAAQATTDGDPLPVAGPAATRPGYSPTGLSPQGPGTSLGLPMAGPTGGVQPPQPTAAVVDPPSDHGPGHGRVIVAPGSHVQAPPSRADGMVGAISSQGIAALKRNGGTSLVYNSGFNGNREVAVLASPHFDPGKPFKVMVYNRGIQGGTAQTLDEQFMGSAIDKLNAEGGNVLLVMPKSPTAMASWFTSKDGDLGKMTDEAISKFAQATGYPLGAPTERILMAHSGGGQSVANAYAGAHPPSPPFNKVLLADSAYGSWAGQFMNALDKVPGPRPQVAAVTIPGTQTDRPGHAQLNPHGVRVDAMPPANTHTDDPARRVEHPGHMGVPAYMLNAYLSDKPGTLSFSNPHPARR